MSADMPRWLLLIGLSLSVAVFTGCGAKTVGRSELSTKFAAREVKATVDGGAFISLQGDDAIVTFGGGKVVVEKARVVLDGKDIGTLPEEAALVEVDVTAGTLTVTVDGKGIATVKLVK